MLVPVILAGGAGTRLWPVSRRAYPKPFIRLPDGRSLLQRTLERAAALPGVGRALTVTNREHYFQTRDEYAACGTDGLRHGYLLEPCGRNTAPAVGLAARRLLEEAGDEAVMLVLPADHLVEDEAAFAEAVSRAERLARAGRLVTFGIRPERPETGYGYIRVGEAVAEGGEVLGHTVERFVEKPDEATARRYLEEGGYLWNSGMFCFRADRILEAMGETAPELLEKVDACWAAVGAREEPLELPRAPFEALPDISVDYAVMERARDVAVVPCELGWSDIGSWDALGTLAPADEAGNRVTGEGVLLLDSRGCVVRSEGGRVVAGIGLEDLVVVDTADAVLVAPRGEAQRVREVVDRLRAAGHESVDYHRTVHRPWGTYTVLEEGERFKIKRIVVKPGASLSLQMHYHRSEHWVVVSGTARVTNGDREWLVRTNESTYIPAGTPHRLENPGVVPLVIIEVQSGEYLGEDDIVRFEDRYGRARPSGEGGSGGDGAAG